MLTRVTLFLAVFWLIATSTIHAIDDCAGYSCPDNPFKCCSAGNCTWWAWCTRQDLNGICTGNAAYWYSQASAANVPTGSEPAVGSIACFWGGDWPEEGHVASVEKVNIDGSFYVSEMGCDWFDGVRNHTYSTGEANGFIYGGPVGDEPTFFGTYVGQTPTDPSGVLHLRPNEIVSCSFSFRNDGNVPWTGNGSSPYYVELHSVNSSWNQDQASILAHNWLNGGNVRIATTTGNVDPAQQGQPPGQGLYSFTIKTPSASGRYTLYVALYHPHSAKYISGTGPKIELEVESGTYLVFFDDFDSYSSVDDPEFQNTWIEASWQGGGEIALVPHNGGNALSISIPNHEWKSVRSSESFPLVRQVECELMNTDFGLSSDGRQWYAGNFVAYRNEAEDSYVGMHYRPTGQDFIIIYKINGIFPMGEYYTCGSNIVISEGQWYKLKIEMDETTISYYYDIGDSYQLLCALSHGLPLLNGGISLEQGGFDAAEAHFDNLITKAEPGTYVAFFDDFDSYLSVDNPEFQNTWSKILWQGIGSTSLSTYNGGQALRISNPGHESTSIRSVQDFPFGRTVECEVMNTDFGQGSTGEQWYAGSLRAYVNLEENNQIGMRYRPVGKDFISNYAVNGTYPYGQFHTFGSNIEISEGQWYKMRVVIKETSISYYYDVGDGYQYLGTLSHSMPLLDGKVELNQQGFDASEAYFDNVIVWGHSNTLLNETVALLPPEYSSQVEELESVDQGGSTILQQLVNIVSQVLKVLLNWGGSEFNLRIYRPDGTLYGEWQSSTPPIEVNIMAPDIGTWDFEVTGVDVPYDNYPFALVVGSMPLGSISGTVTDVSTNGVMGVTVDLFNDANELLSCMTTDQSGYYSFPNLLLGVYDLTIITPLGFTADAESKSVTVVSGEDSLVNFTLTALEITPSQRSMGYWKHQVCVHLSGNGHAQESLADMSNYMGLIGEHFNNNLANPITIFEVLQPATQTDSLEALKDLLTVKGNGTMNDRAKQQLIALMLNVVSLKLHQTTPISEDSATVSQAITYCNQLITDSDPSNDEIAKDIADQINNGILLASGIIPLTTPNIAYKGGEDQITQTSNVPEEFSIEQNYPNPFNPICEIAYALPTDCHVTLTIYNILGQRVRVLVEQYQSAGNKSVKWDGKDHQGREVTSGVYFYRIQAGDFVQSKKMVLLK